MIKQWQAVMCTNKSSRFRAGWIAGALIAAMMVFAHHASAASAPTFQAAGTAQNGTVALTGATAVAWPTHQAEDIGLLIIQTNNQAVTLGTNAADWTQVTNSPQGTGTAGSAGATRLTVFWSRATSNAMGAVGINDSGDHQIAQIITFRGVTNTGNPFDVTAGNVASSASTAVSIPGATTTVANTLVVAIVANATDTTTAQTSGWTNSNLSSVTERADTQNTPGFGGGFGVATGVKATAGAYGTTTATLATSSAQGRMSIALRPPLTTLGTGTNPGNTTIAPSLATPTDVNAFTLQTTGVSNTDTVTAARVTLTGCNAPGCYVGITLVQITDNSNNVKGSVTNPSADIIDITLTTNISVSSTALTYKVRITPKTHANMPVPPGDTYPVAATITSFTSSNDHTGTDTASATVTIDNKSTASITGASATPGAGQATVSWTNPADGDFSNLVVLRNTASITDVPAEGSAPAVDSSVGTSVVRYISNGTSFIDTGLTGGTQYFYRIFAKDSNGNYSATGVEVSATPTAGVTLGQVSNNGNTGQSSLSWSHTTSGTNRVLLVGVSWVGSQTVSSVTYAGTAMTSIGSVINGSNARAQLFYLVAPATGANTVQVTMSAAATEIVGGAVTFTGANQTTPVGTFASATGNSSAPSVTVTSNAGETVIDTVEVNSSTAMTAGGAQTQRWQMQPTNFRGAGSTEPGASTLTMSWTSGSAAWAIGAVGVKPAATCSSVSDATYVTANTQGTQATVYWSSANPVVILRKTAAFGTEAPAGGASYNVNEAIGAATVVFKGAGGETSFNQTSLTAGTTYYYKVFPKTSLPCYAPGIAVNVSPAASSPAWSYATGAASMAPPALDPWSNFVVTGSNDNKLHGTADSDGSLAFAPFTTSGPIQARPATLPAAYRTPSTAVNIAYVTSQDGFAYAVNTGTGAQVWKSPSLGTTLQGGASVWVQALAPLSICGVTTADVVFVGTSNTGNTTNNKVYALNGSSGNVTSSNTGAPNCTNGTVVPGGILWTFSPAAQISVNMDVVSSTPYVDFGNNAVWVTSRAAGGTAQPSVWKLNAATGALVSPGTNTWSFNDIDSSPTPNATGSFIFVGTNVAGALKAIRVSDGTVFTHTPGSGAGAIKGMPWPLWYNAVGAGAGETIIFTRNTTVHSVNFDGSTFTANWAKTLTGTPTLSAPLDDGANHLYIGGSDGRVYQIDADTGNNELTVPTTAISGTMGDPTFNVDLPGIHVGGSDGHIYTFTTPF
jgi:putative pyrroloquinoline-quinone-binding quinoprotein